MSIFIIIQFAILFFQHELHSLATPSLAIDPITPSILNLNRKRSLIHPECNKLFDLCLKTLQKTLGRNNECCVHYMVMEIFLISY